MNTTKYLSKEIVITKEGKRLYRYKYATETNHKFRRGSCIPNKRACAKRHADKFGIPFTLTTEYLRELWDKQEGRCSYSGILLGNIGDGYYSPSIDRIDNSIGYVEGNVHWTIWRVNEMKKNMNHNDFIELCSLISKSAETIPSGSTSQTVGGGSAWTPVSRPEYDIVHSTSGDVAVHKRTYK